MNTLLTVPDIEHLRGQQMKLDEKIMRENNITHDEWMEDLQRNHLIALRVEVAEFINEVRVWKYWKKKPIDRDRVIDEAVDVIHFLMLLWNKEERILSNGRIAEIVERGIPRKGTKVEGLMEVMIKTSNTFHILAYLLYILNDYNFTTSDIIDAYNRKNKVNFERLESGY